MRLGTLVGGCCIGATLGLEAFTACSVQKSGGESVDAAAMEAAMTDVSATEGSAADAETPDTGAADGGVREAAVADAFSETGGDAALCPGALCDGKCLPGGDCHSCGSAPLLCASTRACVATCAGCLDTQGAAMPIQCFACDSNHENPIGTCDYADAGSYCLSGDYLGQYEGGPGYQCGCNDVSACPGATQVCVPLGNYGAGFCLTCGEATIGQIQGQPCKDGGTCQASQAACQ